ncbi:hypothetical protein FCM35_KLT00322 [Carex littledalei]|uniref:MATH domain-containing protein n=1 Tax=Carex littledalei TaxID=544730 RepID=A0A833W367_9POAL|nr:hypothetical protein FCM35_KLT00322 [Carex littledalei]
MKNTASAIDASVKDPITEPEKEVICDMETFSTVYHAKIKHYSQVKLCPRDFSIDCGVFDLAGHSWAIFYYPNLYGYSQDQGTLEIKLLTDTTTSLKQNVKISLIDPSGRHLMVGEAKQVYNKRDDGKRMAFMLNTKLDFSEYVKDDCLTFEFIVSVTKWSPAEVVKKKPQSAITFSNSQEESGTEEADFLFVSNDPEILDIWS